jgi:hypothetical protein
MNNPCFERHIKRKSRLNFAKYGKWNIRHLTFYTKVLVYVEKLKKKKAKMPFCSTNQIRV